ncbi:cadmium-translocating P-type ATPase [Desulfovibrio sp. OttesenSCG-928-G15]|nr:cadmium-translocating P-type ATPase [Desulfovibrio sp. OttesenSCG-928-G15]
MAFFTKPASCCCSGACSAKKSDDHAQGHDHAHDDDHDHDHGHSHEHDGDEEDTRAEIRLLAGCFVVFFATMIFSGTIERLGGIWALRALYAIPYFLCGFSVFRSAFSGMRRGDYLNEFTLMCGATLAAIAIGELPEAVGVMLFYRIGEFFQDRAASGSRRSIKSLLASRPDSANVVENGQTLARPVESVEPGSIIEVRAGEKVPLDGSVLSGESQLDQSPLTGESVPVSVSPGSEVFGGSINLSGVLKVEVSSRFADTHMARILDMVENAAQRKSPTERFITRFARYYTPIVVLVALLVAVLPPLLVAGASFDTWLYRALVMLVISCPCALIISIPLGYFGGIGAASRKGILVKGGNVLDGLMHVDTVVFDKTGTLTKGVFDVAEISPAEGVEPEAVIQAALVAESHSNHPIARSILAYAQAKGLVENTSAPQDAGAAELAVEEVPGKGLKAQSAGSVYLAGTRALLEENGVSLAEQSHPAGALVYVAKDGAYLGCILVTDLIKPDAKEAIAALHAKGFKTLMLTGDRPEAAAWVASSTGIGDFKAGLLPEGKVKAMEELAGNENREEGAHTAFVGDGINDAPILALSRVGIAMGGMGAGAAIEAADAVLLNDAPSQVPVLFNIARRVRNIVWQNIGMALGIKTLFMILGVAGLSGLWEAVFADVGVALLAVLNSTRASHD